MCTQQFQDHITVEQFRELIPYFSDRTKYPRTLIERWLEMMKCAFNPCVWGCQLQWGEANWLAHKLYVFGTGETLPIGGASMFATSKRVGDTSVTYSDAVLQQMMKGGGFSTTPYGQEYLALLNALPQGMGLMIV